MRVPGGPLLPGHVDRVFPDQVQAVGIILQSAHATAVGAGFVTGQGGHQFGVIVEIFRNADDIPIVFRHFLADFLGSAGTRSVTVDGDSQNLLRQTVHIHTDGGETAGGGYRLLFCQSVQRNTGKQQPGSRQSRSNTPEKLFHRNNPSFCTPFLLPGMFRDRPPCPKKAATKIMTAFFQGLCWVPVKMMQKCRCPRESCSRRR